jgi:hypothetical protein
MIHSLWDLFFVGDGREPIAEELSGGQFLPPVQTLVATLIFCLKAENANRVPLSAPKKERLLPLLFIVQVLKLSPFSPQKP